jgi:hypothetical protein
MHHISQATHHYVLTKLLNESHAHCKARIYMTAVIEFQWDIAQGSCKNLHLNIDCLPDLWNNDIPARHQVGCNWDYLFEKIGSFRAVR